MLYHYMESTHRGQLMEMLMREAAVEKLNTRVRGKIVKLHPSGYGFIVSDAMPFTRIYFFWSALEPGEPNFLELKFNDEVEFEIIDYIDKSTGKSKGPRAAHIKVVS